MAGYDGSIRINTLLNTRDFVSSFRRLGSSIRGLLGTLGLGLGIAGLVSLGKQAIETAADFEAMESQFSQVFGELESTASKSLSKIADQAGIAEERMKASYTKIAAFAKTTGMDTASSMELANRAMVAVADSAAFYDRSLEETTESLQSFLKGNYENDAALGLSATETTRNAAANKLYGKSFIELSEAQKQLTLLRMVEDANELSGAMGQAAREADTWTNQVGNLNQAWTNLKATLGKFILPIAIQAVKAITNVINAINALFSRLYAVVSMFRELITGKKISTEISVETQKTGIDMGDEYNEATEGAENLASANDDIAKSAKEAGRAAKGALAPFDDLNVLTQKTGEGASGSASAGGGFEMPSLEMEETGVEEVGAMSSAIDNLLDRMQPLFDWFIKLKNLFKEGFFDGLGESWNERISDIQESTRNIVKNLVDIFTDPSIVTAAQTMIENVIYAMGESLGAVVSIGITIGENLVGGIDMYLSENKDFLKEKLVSIFDIAGDIALLIGEAFKTIAYIFEAFGSESGQQLTANIIGIFADTTLSLLELAGKFGRDILDCIIQPIVDNKEGLRAALEGFLGVFSEVTGTIKQGIDDTFSKLNEVYDAHFKPFFDSVVIGLSELLSHFLDFWNGNVQPMLNEWAHEFDVLWNEHIQPLIDGAIELVGKIADFLTKFWEETLKPLIDWIITNILPIILPIIDSIKSALDTAVANVSDSINTILGKLGEFIDWLSEHQSVVQDFAIIVGVFIASWEVSKLVTSISGIVSALTTFITGGGLAASVAAALGTAINVLGTALAVVTSPITAIASIVGGVIVAVKEFITMLTDGFSWLNEALMVVGVALAAIGAIILGAPALIAGVVAAIVAAVATIIVVIHDNWDAICKWFSGVADWINKNVIQPVIGFFKGVWDSVSGFFSGLWNDIVSIWSAVAGWFSSNVIEPVVNFFQGLWTRVQQIFEGLWIIIQAIWIVVSEWFNTNVIIPIVGFFQGLWESVSGFFTSLWEDIVAVWELVSGWFNENVIIPVTDFFKGVWDNVSEFFSNLWKDIQAVWSVVAGWFNKNIITPVQKAFKAACDAIGGFFSGLWDGIKKGVVGAMNAVIGGIETAINWIVGGINEIINGFNRVVSWTAKVAGVDWGGVDLVPKVSLERIPMLATGAVIRGGNPFMAVLGDQPSGITNIETPLPTMVDAFKQAIVEMSGIGGSERIPVNINIQYDGETFARLSIPDILAELGRQGFNVDALGVN